MQSKTYTVLVTINAHDKAPTPHELANAIQQGLEEGTRDHRSVSAASVDAFEGDCLSAADWHHQTNTIVRVRAFHRHMLQD